MRKTIAAALLASLCLLPPNALAHVQNERSLYEDIQFSDAQREILYLRGIYAIAEPESGAQLFRPAENLSRSDLAYWAALFRTPVAERAGKTPEALRQQAVTDKLVPSLDGDATYADVNTSYFGGALQPQTPDATLTREQFATFLAGYLEENAAGQSLLEQAGATKGPIGVVEAVAEKTETHDGAASTVTFLTVGGQEYRVGVHPKMLYGPTDLKLWQGKTIEDSWLLDEGDGTPVLMIAALAEDSFTDEQIASGGEHSHGGAAADDTAAASHDEAGHGDATPTASASEASTPPTNPLATYAFPIGAVALLLVIGVWVFWRRKERA